MNIKISNFINPFIIYGIITIIILLLYSLGWSDLFPSLQITLLFFLIITVIISLFIGILLNNYKIIKYKPAIEKSTTYYISMLLFLILLYISDYTYSKEIPIFQKKYLEYTTYGRPFFHVLFCSFSIFYATLLFHIFITTKKIKYLIIYFIIILLNISVYRRSMVSWIFISSILIYLQKINTLNFKIIIILPLLLFVFSWLFGYLGNLRNDLDEDFTIKYMGGSTKFIETKLNNNHYLTYLYICSPLANLQYNIKYGKPKNINSNNVKLFFFSDIMFDSFYNRLKKKFNINDDRPVLRITPTLTASTLFSKPFLSLGWIGSILIFIYLILFLFCSLFINNSLSEYHVTINSLLCCTVAFCFFDNILNMILVILLNIFPVLLNTIENFIYKKT